MSTPDYLYAYSVSLADGPFSTSSPTNPFSIVGRQDAFGDVVAPYTNLTITGTTASTLADGTKFIATADEIVGTSVVTKTLNLEVVTAGYDANNDEGWVVEGLNAHGNPSGQFFFLLNSPYTGAAGPDPAARLTDTAFDGGGNTDPLPVCFCAETEISTSRGQVSVENLNIGDVVLTSDGRQTMVRWVGRQKMSRRFCDELKLPVRVKAGALGENTPSRDLLLSPEHALFVDGILIHAGALVNGSSIVRETNVESIFFYYHVEVDDHSLILAENTPVETFVDNVDRMAFDNWDEYEALYPEGKNIVEMPYARAKAYRQVPVAVRTRLADRAILLGYHGMAFAA